MSSLLVHAGPRAREQLRRHGLRAGDVRAVAAAAGGPKGLVFNALDRWLFGHWLTGPGAPVHLFGASIGAWRMAVACARDAGAGFAELAEDYVMQRYEHAPGRRPHPRHVSEVFGRTLDQRLGRRAAELLSHPRFRLHVITSRGRHLLGREGRVRTPAGWLGAFVTNAASRRALGAWVERVVFSDPRDPLPLSLADYPSRQVPLDAANLAPAVQASCTIPFWMQAVHDVPGGPRGAYWDGGITDYHLHLDWAGMPDGLVLYPHFAPQLVPGWLDKAWKHRHRASARLDNVVVISPAPEWVATLPGGRLPDRSDFKAYGDDHAARQRVWRRAIAEAGRLAEDFAAQVDRPIDALPLP